jgi:predicted DNA-binding protein
MSHAKTARGAKKRVLNVLLDPGVYDRLSRRSKAEGRPRAAHVRWLIRKDAEKVETEQAAEAV